MSIKFLVLGGGYFGFRRGGGEVPIIFFLALLLCLFWKRPKGTRPKGTGGKVNF